ncbi:MAG: aspartate aminotransferase family protein [Trueperaceae bacterium]
MTVTTSKTQELLERQERVLLPIQSKMLYYGDEPLAVERAKDQYLWDVEGNRYLDFFGGILTVSVGHCNDEVVEATAQQLRTAGHTSTLYLNEITIKVAEKIAEVTPGALQYTFFTNSGSEADEMAVMAARTHTGNSDIIALRHAYSGRTAAMMGLTAHSNWRQGGVYDGGIKHVRSPNMYRRPEGMSEEQYLDFLVQDLEDFIATCTDGRIAAFMAEPIQGVGGFAVVPKDYFRRILPIVKAAGGVLIIDEVQTGWGRTGKYWCGIEHWGVEPDIITFAKGIANGAPVGATVMTKEIADSVQGLTLSTYGGNPVSMAQTWATLEYIEKNRLWENAEKQGARLRARLEEMACDYDFIGDVRGMGLMQAFEFVMPGSKEPNPAKASELVNVARKNGLLIGKGGRGGNAIRIAPHLNVQSEDLETGCDLIAKSLAAIA